MSRRKPQFAGPSDHAWAPPPPKPCRCKPCKTCGLKHGCNLAVPHPGGWVRVIGEPYCPAPRAALRAAKGK